MSAATSPTTAGLAFEPGPHTYTLDGRRLVSVTQLLDSCGLVAGKEHFTEESRARGQAVHEAIALIEEGALDPSTVDPRIEGYLAAYRRFAAEMRPTTYLFECRLASRRWRFAGTFDWLGWLGGENSLTLLDYKTGAYADWQDIQLELYARLLAENAAALALDAAPARRIVCQLKKDGTYKLHTPTLSPALVAGIANGLLAIHLYREGRLAA